MSLVMKNIVPEKENVADKMEKFSLKVIKLFKLKCVKVRS